MRWKEFATGFTDKIFVEKILKDVKTSKKNREKGKPYKGAKEMCEEYSISMENLVTIIEAEKSAKELDGGKFKLSGNVRVLDNGSIGRSYSRAGELMVECIEDAYRELDFKVPITGEYLVASPEEGWGGSH